MTMLAGRHHTIRGARALEAADVPEAVVVRFLERARAVGECLEYDGARNADGYGVVRLRSGRRRGSGRLVLAHRLAFALANGAVPGGTEEVLVDHTCSNRACVRPSHLRLVAIEWNTPAIYGLVDGEDAPPADDEGIPL